MTLMALRSRRSQKAGPGARPMRGKMLLLGVLCGAFVCRWDGVGGRDGAGVERSVVPPRDVVTAGRGIFHPVEFRGHRADPDRRHLARLRHADAASECRSGRPGADGGGCERRGPGAWQGKFYARRLSPDVHVARGGDAARAIGDGQVYRHGGFADASGASPSERSGASCPSVRLPYLRDASATSRCAAPNSN